MRKSCNKMWTKILMVGLCGAIAFSPLLVATKAAAEDAVEFTAEELAVMSNADVQGLDEIQALEAELIADTADEDIGEGADGEDPDADAMEDLEDAFADVMEFSSEEEVAAIVEVLEELNPDTVAQELAKEGDDGEEFWGAIAGIAAPLAQKAITGLGKSALNKIGSWIGKKFKKNKAVGVKALGVVKKTANLVKKVKKSPSVLKKYLAKPKGKKLPLKLSFKPLKPRPIKPPVGIIGGIFPGLPIIGTNVKITTTARVCYGGPIAPPTGGKLQICAPKQIHLSIKRPGGVSTRNLPVKVTNSTGKAATLKVYGTDNLKKTFGIGPAKMSTKYSLTRSMALPKWIAAPSFKGVTDGSSSMGNGITNLCLRCSVVATTNMKSGSVYSNKWGMRLISYRAGVGSEAEDATALSEEDVEEIKEMDESDVEELIEMEAGQGTEADEEALSVDVDPNDDEV